MDASSTNKGDWVDYWSAYASGFAQPLQTNDLVSRFVTNTAVTGAYAEAWVRFMVRRMLELKYRISTGAVVRSSDLKRGIDKVPQCDLIVWDSSIMPGLFEVGEFAIVPNLCTKALIEIKRTLKRKELAAQLEQQQALVPGGPNRVLGVVVSHPTSLFKLVCEPNWLQHTGTPQMTRLLDSKNKPDTDGVLAFIYFLAQIAGHDEPAV